MPTLFSFDIETETSLPRFRYPNGTESNMPSGLDPRIAPVTSVSIAGSDGTRVLLDTPREEMLLNVVETFLYRVAMDGDVLVTWGGTGFDLPFLKLRGVDVELGYWLESDPEPKYGWPEWAELVRPEGRWSERASMDTMDFEHVDIAPLFKGYAEQAGVPHKLKDVYRAITGKEPIEVDRTQMHLLSLGERLAYSLSDAEIELELVEFAVELGWVTISEALGTNETSGR